MCFHRQLSCAVEWIRESLEGARTGPIHSLRRLGAIVDFECDKAVFRHVDPRKVVKLERSAAGHQVLPLTEDAFKDAQELEHPVPAFDDLG